MSMQMSSVKIYEHGRCDFSALRKVGKFNATIFTSYIAPARYVGTNEIEILVLDSSEAAESIRTASQIEFDIELESGCRLKGAAIATIIESNLTNERRVLRVSLSLITAKEIQSAHKPVKWST